MTLAFAAALAGTLVVPAGAPGQIPLWRADFSFALAAAGFVVVLIALARTVGSRSALLGGQGAARGLQRAQRRRAARQVRRGSPPPHQEGEEVALTARAMVVQGSMALFFAGLALTMGGAAVGGGGWWPLVLGTLGVLVALVGVVVVVRDAHLARRWLGEHHRATAG